MVRLDVASESGEHVMAVCGYLGDDAGNGFLDGTITTIVLSIDGSRRRGPGFGKVGGDGDKRSEQIHLNVCKLKRSCVVVLGL